MQNEDLLDDTAYEWRPCHLTVPRFGLLLDRYGVRTRLIWPGRYMVRKSRTYSRPIYRRRF
jgi:hypothetical protein